ncbi:DNA polymerase III subunit delta [Rhodospirillum rubrum]|uniref:DNA-directed DNA polymerase n=1 Tax=Rhodospirillum rubrum (strain ATCC 11170 / ATH 1.1.1 / DSM 467 / LMG 4362 / NCIMB 8255 / S1) TaxID=269796 RepID=Q2RN72_RHORT|nr:DNA polymerase III subunit delta [Rhodospirillum rubrum]ABC24423.1 DNA polymerase III, delta subunit [Rhodospirillum rubrum ATCC 11170]AEO50174.1 DNA polymerase III subunit delta [Rhodospirillum rubrum F11]MBK5956143.1 DNA polymerase III subunit delta [Rhodospirillum rubrum]QXG80345.1 DNA polymerase III subunit delta [Rhodospirillum rubrum]
MKLTGQAIDGFLRKPDPKIRCVLVYGPDEGLVRERLEQLARTVVADPKDPFRITDLSGDDLRADPARLADEAAALAFGGGRRLVRLRQMTDQHAPRLKAFVEAPVGEALVLVQGGDLTARSALRKLFEGASAAAALPCYADEGRSLETLVRATLAEARLAAAPEVIDYLVANLGGDRGVSRSELAKLVTYCGKATSVSLDDALACVGDSAQIGLDMLTNAVAEGDSATALRALDRLGQEGMATVALLRGLTRHFTRLHLVAGLIAGGTSVDQALAALKPPVMFKLAPRFRSQVQRWSAERLAQALDLLLDAEIDAKSSGLPERALVERLLLRLARGAKTASR